MSTQAVGSTTSGTSTSQLTKQASMVNKNDFLKILMTQIKYQDPMEPMKADQFMAQLAQLTQVEQLQNISDSLDTMKNTSATGSLTQWLSAVGKKMGVDGQVMSKGDMITLNPQGDYDSVALGLTNTTTGETKAITFAKGEELSYTYQGDGSVQVSAVAVKSGMAVNCNSSLYRLITGIQTGSTGPVLVAGNGDTYATDKIKQIIE
jgi:flagellar hook assembly protein FlgD